jgi:hypothetical protein
MTASSAEAVIQSFNTHHITRIPFVVDHLGSLGPFAANLLFSPQDSPLTTPPTPISAYNLKNPSTTTTHDVAAASSLHLASHVTRT